MATERAAHLLEMGIIDLVQQQFGMRPLLRSALNLALRRFDNQVFA